jgi:hypothetical protein
MSKTNDFGKGSKKRLDAGAKRSETLKQRKLFAQFNAEAIGKKAQQLGGLKNHYKSLGLNFSLFEEKVEKKKQKKEKKKRGLKISERKTVANDLEDKKPIVKLDVSNMKHVYIHEINGKIVLSVSETLKGKVELKEVASPMQSKVYVGKTQGNQKYNVETNETLVSFY